MDRIRVEAARRYEPWPQWCYAPMAVASAVLSAHELIDIDHPSEDLALVGIVAALYAWRLGRGIYGYAPELAEALIDSDVPSDLGADVLLRLPEWAVYIDAAGAIVPETLGLWVHLEWDVGERRTELRFVFDLASGGLQPFLIPLGHASLAEALDAALANSRRKGGP